MKKATQKEQVDNRINLNKVGEPNRFNNMAVVLLFIFTAVFKWDIQVIFAFYTTNSGREKDGVEMGGRRELINVKMGKCRTKFIGAFASKGR